jgi:hypothetical protein
MRHRLIFLVSSVLLGSAGAFGLACSSPKGDDDGGTDGSMMGDGDMVDTGMKDSGKDGGGGPNPPCPSYPIKGACDLVQQNCPSGQQCEVQVDGGATVAVCAPASSGSSPIGGKCATTGDCVPGCECIQQRCAPYCCMGQDQECKQSVPEGYIGTCSINVQYQGAMPNGLVCSYAGGCQPFGIMPCAQGSACLVEDMAGKSDCNAIFMPPGKMAGQACQYKNDCAEGLMCVGGGPDGGTICMWMCYKPPGPFDAGIATLGAGKGGCPNGKTCSIGIQGLPTWLNVCTP